MKKIYRHLLAFSTLALSCGQGTGSSHENKDSSAAVKPTPAEAIPAGLEKLEFTDSLILTANENMRFSKELFRVHAGKKILLLFTNTGAKSAGSMSHNVVILKGGTDLADFAEVAQKAKAEQYVPASLDSIVIAHTRLVGAGETDTLSFTLSRSGEYDFICSFPGHWGTMQGKIVAE